MKISLLLILCSFAVLSVAGQNIKTDHNASQNRIFDNKTVGLVQLDSIYLADVELFRPELFSLNDEKNKLFVFDYSAKNLFSVKISSPSKVQISDVMEIGNGGGSGPGEFRNPTDLCVSNTPSGERVVVIDPQLGRVYIWDTASSSLVNSFRPKKFIPFRVACNEEKIIVYNTGYIDSGNYGIYDYQGKFISFIKDPTLGKNADSFTGSGYISSDDSLIYFAGMDDNVLKYFNLSDFKYKEKRRFVESQDLSNDPEVTKNDKTITRRRGKNFLYQARGSGIFDNYLVTLFSGRKDGYGNILDFYNVKDLTYSFSIKLEDLSSRMVIKDNILILKAYDFERKDSHLKFYEIVEN